jgi:hypothetical protein
MLTGFLVPSAAVADVLSDARWRFRLVVVNVAAENDPLRSAQRAEVDRDAAGWSERRMRLVEVVGYRATCNGRSLLPLPRKSAPRWRCRRTLGRCC